MVWTLDCWCTVEEGCSVEEPEVVCLSCLSYASHIIKTLLGAVSPNCC